jgi:hypothetical protein
VYLKCSFGLPDRTSIGPEMLDAITQYLLETNLFCSFLDAARLLPLLVVRNAVNSSATLPTFGLVVYLFILISTNSHA